MEKGKLINLGEEKVKRFFESPSKVQELMELIANYDQVNKGSEDSLKQDLINAGFKAINESKFGRKLFHASHYLGDFDSEFCVWADSEEDAERMSLNFIKEDDIFSFYEIIDTDGNVDFF